MSEHEVIIGALTLAQRATSELHSASDCEAEKARLYRAAECIRQAIASVKSTIKEN